MENKYEAKTGNEWKTNMKQRQGIHGKQIGNTDRKNMENKYEPKTGNHGKKIGNKCKKNMSTETRNIWQADRKCSQW